MENLEITNVFKFFEDNPKLTRSMVSTGRDFLDRVNKYNLTKYKIITLNDSITVCKRCSTGTFIDLDAFERCSGEIALEKICIYTWYPHVNSRPSTKKLIDH